GSTVYPRSSVLKSPFSITGRIRAWSTSARHGVDISGGDGSLQSHSTRCIRCPQRDRIMPEAGMGDVGSREKTLFVLIAGLAALCAGAVKWRRCAELRKQIAIYTREEKLLLADYRAGVQLPSKCGNYQRYNAACLAVAAERRRRIKECER